MDKIKDLSVIIPARNEEFLQRTIENILENIEADTEVIAVCDGCWPDPPVYDHSRVTIIHYTDSIGQRAATNAGVRLSQAKFVMKADAHCAFDKGFDRKLMDGCEYDWTLVPVMYNLHAFDWMCKACGDRLYQGPKPEKCTKCGSTLEFEKVIVWQPRWNRVTYSWRFDSDMHFQYWQAHRKRKETRRGDYIETMSFIGACWFMHRDRWWEIDGLDEAHGSWGQVGTEIACKSWLSGGKLLTCKKTWFSHMFRTNHKGFSFPYPISGNAQERSKKYSRELWLNDKWPKAKRPLSWLVEKFAPVPGWPDGGGKK
jgi:glycosyltransferase involved in cell wall biosynthesis